jgi:hypothetical protein
LEGQNKTETTAAAEQAHAADAASRPQDPSFFEGWYQFDRFPDL